MSDDGLVGLMFNDADGKPRAAIGLDKDGNPVVLSTDEDGNPVPFQ